MTWIDASVSVETSGFSQRKNGTMNRDVCSADIRSVEPKKITPSQRSGGAQYLMKRLNFIHVAAGASPAN
jgi:hypothetical protein